MKNKYHTNSHSKYLIKLHFVIAIKYRKRLLVGSIKDDIMQIIYDVCNDNKWIIDEMESEIAKYRSIDRKYKLKCSFIFEGTVTVEANTIHDAKDIVNDSFGLVIGSNLHESDSRIVDWDFSTHPTKIVEYENNATQLRNIKVGQEVLYKYIEQYEMAEYGASSIGESFVVCSDNSGDLIVSFVLTGTQGDNYVYRCIYSNYAKNH